MLKRKKDGRTHFFREPNSQFLETIKRLAQVDFRKDFWDRETRRRMGRVGFRKDFWDREIGTRRSAIGQFFCQSPVTVPEVFAKVYSA